MPWQGSDRFAYDFFPILRHAPMESGIYGMFSRGKWVYIGEADDLRTRLLRHWDGDDPAINWHRPTHVAFELVPVARRSARQQELIRAFQPVCNVGLSGVPRSNVAEPLPGRSEEVIPKVLVVDDEAGLVDQLQRFLASKGYAVSTAADGLEALQKVQDERPDVVLLDINLPRMNGLEVLRRVRASDPAVAVIMVSGLSDEATSRRALALGALAYLTKPLSFRALEQRLGTLR